MLLCDVADPVAAMARALAVMSGYTDGIAVRSLLTSSEGFQTLRFTSSIPIKTPQFVWNSLAKFIPQDVIYAARGITLTKDELGAVFDMPVDKLPKVRLRVAVALAHPCC
jgi:hypothetical protein